MKILFIIFSFFITLPIIIFTIYKLFNLILNNFFDLYKIIPFGFGIILYITIIFIIFVFFKKCITKFNNNEKLEYELYIYYICIAILYGFCARLFNF